MAVDSAASRVARRGLRLRNILEWTMELEMSTKTRAIVATVAGTFSVCAISADLTPVGAERAGNSDGTIPVFEGKDVPATGWAWGKYRGDYWVHKSESPLFVIDASNVGKYADKLSPGQVELIKTKKGYTMPV